MQFQSTLPRRERRYKRRYRCGFIYFNPRSHEGSDYVNVTSCRLSAISIHAPTKGATHFPLCPSVHSHYFNPRSHEGSDAFSIVSVSSFALFQSTLPRRERLYSFNFSPPVQKISIHAPTKGATYFHHLFINFNLFQSTLPRRERQQLICKHQFHLRISIHAPTKGATRRSKVFG